MLSTIQKQVVDYCSGEYRPSSKDEEIKFLTDPSVSGMINNKYR
jgi:hypothetical protein